MLMRNTRKKKQLFTEANKSDSQSSGAGLKYKKRDKYLNFGFTHCGFVNQPFLSVWYVEKTAISLRYLVN